MDSRSEKITRYSALIALVAALLPTYLIRFSIVSIPTNLFEVTVGLLLLAGLAQASVRAQWQAAWHRFPRPIALFIGLFFLACIISTVVSPHAETSLGILKGWIIAPMVFGWIVYASKPPGVRNYELGIMNGLLVSGVGVAFLGISQIGTLDRVQSIYDVPNSLALFLAPLIVLSFFYSLRVTGYSLLYRFAALVMFIALLATKSLAGIGSVVAVLGVAVTVYAIRKKYSLRVTRYGLLVFLLLLPIAVPKISYLMDYPSSAHVRLQLWSVSWDLIKENPILGIGLGTFEPAYQAVLHERFTNYELQITNYTRPLPEFVFRDPHNWVLSFWLNTGLLGLLSFVGIHVYVFRRVYKLRITNYELLAVMLAIATLLLHGLVDTMYWKNDLAALHWVILALLVIPLFKIS